MSPYSLSVEPQPAALIRIASTCSFSKLAMSARANAFASSGRPLCSDSAPQQPCPCGTTTSQPSALSTRIVAALTRGKSARCTQPATSATRARRSPFANVRYGSDANVSRSLTGGAIVASCRSRAGSSLPSRPDAARDKPSFAPSHSPGIIARNRFGYGNSANTSSRNARSPAGRVIASSTFARVASISRS